MACYDLFAVGGALVDTELRVDDAWLREHGVDKGLMTTIDEPGQRAVLDGMLARGARPERACGGSAANTAIAYAGMGGSAFFTCAVADDEDGRFYLDEMARSSVRCNRELATRAGVTGRCLVLVSPDAERSMVTFLGASERLAATQLDERALADSALVYLEGYLVASPNGFATVLKTAELARRAGIGIALTLSDPGIVSAFREELGAVADGGLNMLFCNADEACAWSKTDDLTAAAAALEPLSQRIAVTRGAEGVMVGEAGRWTQCDAVAVEAVDSNGAGDMFAGACLRALSLGYALPRAAEFAAAAAAEVVGHFGPRLAPARYRALATAL